MPGKLESSWYLLLLSDRLIHVVISNKFRAIMKQLETDGATWAKPASDADASPAKPKVAVKKRKTQTGDAADDDAEDSAEEEASPSKKPKTKKGIAKPTKKSIKSEAVVKEENGEEEDGADGTVAH